MVIDLFIKRCPVKSNVHWILVYVRTIKVMNITYILLPVTPNCYPRFYGIRRGAYIAHD
jgi:hypothetical protein